MKINYEEVPNIITGKDLDYLSDMFEWNISSYKKFSDCLSKINDEEVKELMEENVKLFKSNIEEILSILNQGGSNE